MKIAAVRTGAARCWRFLGRVVKDFRTSQGFVFSSAIAYNALLSIIPFCLLLLIALAKIVDPGELRRTLRRNVQLIVPGKIDPVMEQLNAFLDNRGVISVFGMLSLIVFSGIAFSVLEHAMAVIFRHRTARRRHFLVSFLLPYAFVAVLAVALFGFTVLASAINALGGQTFDALGTPVTTSRLGAATLYLASLVGLTLAMAALYRVLPVGRTPLRHALIGGLVATLLWEGARRLLVWYFASFSTVNLIYGSIATTVVILVGFEVAALIVLVGAEVIAELERGAIRAAEGK